MEPKNICPICLRTDIKLKVIPTTLSVYHDELTDYFLSLKNPRYCGYCECLLRKTYNFQQKCIRAAKILQKWMKTTTKKKRPADLLHLKLPPISLDRWTSENNKTFNYIGADDLEIAIPIKEINMPEKLNTNDIKVADLASILHTEEILKNELKYECYLNTAATDTTFQNVNNGTEDTINVFENELIQENSNNSITDTEVSDTIDYEDNNIDSSQEGLIDTMIHTHDRPGLGAVQSKAPKSFIQLDLDDIKNHINNIHIRKGDENEYPDDASLNSNDDCDEYLYSPMKKRKIKDRTPDESLINIAFGDDHLDHDYVHVANRSVEDNSTDMYISKANTAISKLETMNETLGSICENWEVISLADASDVGNLTYDEVKQITRTFLTERKPFIKLKYSRRVMVTTRLGRMNTDLDFINEMCVNTVENNKRGLWAPKDRLKALLNTLTDLGTYVDSYDKDVVINCLDMVSDKMVQRLLDLMEDFPTTRRLVPGAVRLLKIIQGRQQFSQYESVFDIEFLTTEHDRLEEFERRKTYECFVNAEHKCNMCYQGFKSKGYLEYHMKLHDEKSGQYCCDICNIRHFSKKGHRKHLSLHDEVFKCKLCPLVTYYRWSMVNHYHQHTGTIYKCDKCDKSYKSKSAFAYHQSCAHPRGAHVCAACGYGFISPVGLHSHVLRKHVGETTVSTDGSAFSCEECSLVFVTEEACCRHQRLAHGKVPRRPFTPRKIARKRKLSATEKQRKKPIMICPECKAVGHSYGWMVKHFATEHPAIDVSTVYLDKQKYLCHICGKGFANKYGLRDHMGCHSGAAFPCPTCGKQFCSQPRLQQHRARHAPPAYCCERCGKNFHSYSNLYNHLRRHIGDRSYKCHICGKGFIYKHCLTEHVRGVHNQERRVRKRGVTTATCRVTDASCGVTDVSCGVMDTFDDITEIGAEVVLATGSEVVDE